MQCSDARGLIGPAMDGELDEPQRQLLARHLDACPTCARVAHDLLHVRAGLSALGRQAAPPALLARVRSDLHTAAAAMPAIEATPGPRNRTSPFPAWARQVAVLATVACMSALLAVAGTRALLQHADARDLIRRDVLAAHMRALLSDAPIQVASAETHTVKPWFAGRVDIAPNVRDLAGDGFTLLGGRVDYVDGRRVAVLVYRQQQHLIDVFVWPETAASAPGAAPEAAVRNGYNIVGWTREGVRYCAISDLNAPELRRLAGLL